MAMAHSRQIVTAISINRPTPGATSFAIMFGLESTARASLATVIPLQAYAILSDARDVSILFLAVAGAGLAASFAIPLLVRHIGRRWVYPLGGACLVLCAAALATGTPASLVIGMLARVFGAACLNITLSLYIMDYIQKRDLVRSEPRKFLFSAGAWTVGPSLGIFLQTQLGGWSAYAFSGLFSLLLLANFWRMRLRDDPTVARATKSPSNPVASIGRFTRQPRLRLAWAIAFARTCWWGIFLNYLPLFIVSAGVDSQIGALMVSCGNAMLFLTPLWGRVGARFGVRTTIMGGFAVAGGAAILSWLTASWPLFAGVLMVLGALGATCLDALGTIPFLRAVHPFERPEMVAVYRTNQDTADFVSNAALSIFLSFFALPIVFLAAAVVTLSLAAVSHHLPRSM
jgi:MFS family permease